MKLKPYPEYKDSGVEWIGKIPDKWETQKMKNLIFFQEGPGLRNWQFKDEGIRVICVTNITENGINFSNYEKFISEEEYKHSYRHFTVEKGDLLLSSSGNSWGKVAEYLSDEKVILNTSTIRINENLFKKEVSKKFLKWALQSDSVREQLGLMMTGSCQPNFGPSHLSEAIMCYPNLNEQIHIAYYLDKKTSQIDKTIQKDTRLIELLKEKRTAMINHAVTKGVDPDAKMKDSGVEWIGEIPEGWEVNKLKLSVSKIGSGITPKGGASVYVEKGIALLRSQNIHFEGLKIDNVSYITEEINKTMLNSVVKNHDVLLNITGASIGRCTYFENQVDKANVNQHVCIIRPKTICYRFLNYILMSNIGQDQIFSVQMGSSREGLNFEQIGNFKIVYPPYDEQQKITNYLDESISKIDETIQKIEKKIELLEEYKKSLIHHVVTGKVNVLKED
ncbi:restriction endonuclease subunit S [Methanobacterium aggregans]|uniref:restriction endonuclease subunit S n=1 Tax=Methanobacterium aggregans TaxID=1615586 RepID=UPI001AE4C821|nr:restriction endonuclease subunit S [Methanobacterium aggregans]MBP2044867.1 type I restriction enzyme S subunit [Methanobacterium aggregans]